MRRKRVWLAGCLTVAAASWVAWPVRYVVEGPSMAPGLLPGDVVSSGRFPLRDRFRTPRRFERWILLAEDRATAIKRVVGLPGEMVSIAAGDLVVGGCTVLKGPAQLAEMGMCGAAPPHAANVWRMEPREILDDAGIDAGRSIRLLPVRDAGFAAVISVAAPTGHGGRIRAVVGRVAVAWRLLAPGRYAVVAGRLDGHVVATAWPLAAAGAADRDRSCLPPQPPHDWDVARSWPDADGDEPRTPRLELMVEPQDAGPVAIERVTAWRDVLYRPAAEGRTTWKTDPDAVFVLGDHPAASRDSRHWGVVPLTALRHRVAAIRPRTP